MNIPTLPEPVYISRQAAFERLVEGLQRETMLAVDTESNSLHAYKERVCLIQFSTNSQDYLVDPLALKDISALGSIFSNPQIEKVFHAAEYDLICLKRDFGFSFAGLFDTMIAARILAWEEVGLGAILEREFDVYVDKRHQRADWGKRPLTPQLLSYAQIDTHYLIALRNRLSQELDQKNLAPLAHEDFNRLVQVIGKQHDDKFDVWRIQGVMDLHPQDVAVLAELCLYRDQSARQMDRPLFKVISDQTLLVIARQRPASYGELSKVPGMSPNQVRRHGQALLSAIQRGLQAQPLRYTRPPRPNEQYLERLEKLRTWRKITAQNIGVNSDVVLPRDLLYHLAEINPKSQPELHTVLNDVPWRLEHFGAQIMQVLGRH